FLIERDLFCAHANLRWWCQYSAGTVSSPWSVVSGEDSQSGGLLLTTDHGLLTVFDHFSTTAMMSSSCMMRIASFDPRSLNSSPAQVVNRTVSPSLTWSGRRLP